MITGKARIQHGQGAGTKVESKKIQKGLILKNTHLKGEQTIFLSLVHTQISHLRLFGHRYTYECHSPYECHSR